MQYQGVQDQQCQLELEATNGTAPNADQASVYYTKKEEIEDDGHQ